MRDSKRRRMAMSERPDPLTILLEARAEVASAVPERLVVDIYKTEARVQFHERRTDVPPTIARAVKVVLDEEAEGETGGGGGPGVAAADSGRTDSVMRLNAVTMHNFGPYRDTHMVTFGGDRPITVVHGPNMHGKTSFLNAIRWCLYGKVPDRRGYPLSVTKLINSLAAAAGHWTMRVTLDFTVDGVPYRLERHVQPKHSRTTPRYDGDFELELFLKRDDIHLREPQIEINQILPEKISRFFLFDGEMLNQYEELLADQRQQDLAVRQSIEDILGVPAIEHALTDLEVNRREANRRLQRIAAQRQQSEVFARQADQLDAQVEELEQEVGRLAAERDERAGRHTELEAEFQEAAGAAEAATRLQEYKEQIKSLTEREKERGQELQGHLARVWTDLLYTRVRARREALEAERDDLYARTSRAAELTAQLAALDQFDASGTCPTCGQSRTDAAAAKACEDRTRLGAELAATAVDPARIEKLTASIRRLRLQPANVASGVIQIERELQRIVRDKVRAEQLRDDLNEQLAGHHVESIARNRSEANELAGEIYALKQSIAAAEKQIGEKKREADDYRAKIKAEADPVLRRLDREVEVYKGLVATFQRGKAALSRALSEAVERDAAEIFRTLTTDKSYQGLKINEWYGLRILDSDGAEVPVRSAGAEQVVALSLIGALNRNAVKHGPVIMDTPFGRLDPSHRENILRLLPKLVDQVVLLVHGGEIDVDRDLQHVRDQIDAEFEIRKLSSHESEVVRLGA